MKLLAIDSNSILNRAYYGVRPLTTKDGIYTNGIYGFLTIFLKICEETAPDAVAFAFDLKAPPSGTSSTPNTRPDAMACPTNWQCSCPISRSCWRSWAIRW